MNIGLEEQVDLALAAALQGQDLLGPSLDASDLTVECLIRRAHYHGIAGLLLSNGKNASHFPKPVELAFREIATGQALWELRHRVILNQVLDSCLAQQVHVIVLKGTALAYDLYAIPATRPRGDTDLLANASDLQHIREILERCGFQRSTPRAGVFGDLHHQESWDLSCADGTEHSIDLHWHLMNAAALADLFTFAECSEQARSLPKLGPAALTMSRPLMLLHACLHMAGHANAPYYVEGEAYYGGWRLIWAFDVHLLAASFSRTQWDQFVALATDKQVAALCLERLRYAQNNLGSPIPMDVERALAGEAEPGSAATYLLSSSAGYRAWADLCAQAGPLGMAKFLLSRAFPSREFMEERHSYRRWPLVLLYLRRALKWALGSSLTKFPFRKRSG